MSKLYSISILLVFFFYSIGHSYSQYFLNEDVQFFADFEGERIESMFVEDGMFVLPDYPVSQRFEWLLSELQVGENTTAAEVEGNFVEAFDTQTIVDFINSLRNDFPDAYIKDIHTITLADAVITVTSDDPEDRNGFFVMKTNYLGQQKINFLQAFFSFGLPQFPDDQNLTLTQAADKFLTLSADNGVYIGYVNDSDQCVAIEQRNGNVERGIASINKMYVLGGVAERVVLGEISATDTVELLAAELAAGGDLNLLPLGTPFSLQEMATLMMGVSDNTATDHLHEIAGRDLVGDIVSFYQHANPNVLLPYLNISEQFHLTSRFNRSDALSYHNGTEAFQQNFLTDRIIPEGPSYPVNFPFFHGDLLSEITWQASPKDICQALVGLRSTPTDNGAFEMVDIAMSASPAQAPLSSSWNRTWYKGGSLVSGATGHHVLTNAWMLEQGGDLPPIVVVTMANDTAGGIDEFEVQSINSRILELVTEYLQ